MQTLADCHVVVLAAGQGKRMGCPKALLSLAGEHWWQWQSRALDHLGAAHTWVVSAAVEEHLAGELEAPYQRVLADSQAPPFESLLAGLQSLHTTAPIGVFVLPVDVPVPDLAVWQTLMGQDAPAIPVYDSKRGHPPYLPWAWIDRSILKAGPSSPRRLDHLLAGMALEIVVDDPRVVMNLNTPEDVSAFVRKSRDKEQSDAT